MKIDTRNVALAYLKAHAEKDIQRLLELYADDIQFVGSARTLSGARDTINALKRLTAIHVRNDLQHLFVDGDDACVIYDFVTDTSVGVVRTVEWLHLEDGRIRSIRAVFDQLPWKTVLEELSRRASAS